MVFLAFLLVPLFTQVKGLLLLGAAVVGGIGAVWIIYKPFWGVLTIITAMVLDIDPIGIPGLGIPYLVSMVLLLPLTFTLLRAREIWVWRLPQIRILLFIGVLFAISVGWNYYRFTLPSSPDTNRMLTIFFTRLAFLVFFLYFINTRERIEWSVWLILAITVFLSLHALEDFITKSGPHGHFGEDRAHAAFSMAQNANRLAYVSLFATCLLWFYYSHRKAAWWGKLFIFPLFLLLPLTTFTTGSRSGFLQTLLLGTFILKEQQGWSLVRRARTFLLLGLAGLVVLIAVPAHDITRATSFDPNEETAGQVSLQNRIATDFSAIKIALSYPFLGVGLGNFPVIAATTPGVGTRSKTSNSYTWAMTSGGMGVFTLYMLFHLLTYRALRRLESSGPPELVWLSKGLKVNLFLFLLFSFFADFWLSDFFYFLAVLPIAMTLYWQRQSHHSRQFQAAFARRQTARRAAIRQRQPAPQIFSPSPSTSA
ncbi:MAG: hypothetical protein HY268_07200 [Deltaproteobacteria bacterium]|nr:hypothetical protein [Deltaproteobacteria bacterium]